VACYVSQKVLHVFAVLPFFPPETEDFMALDVFTPRGCFDSILLVLELVILMPDHSPLPQTRFPPSHPFWTLTTPVTASKVVAGIDRVTILSLYQSAVYNETKYRRLRLSCCNKLRTILQLPSSS